MDTYSRHKATPPLPVLVLQRSRHPLSGTGNRSTELPHSTDGMTPMRVHPGAKPLSNALKASGDCAWNTLLPHPQLRLSDVAPVFSTKRQHKPTLARPAERTAALQMELGTTPLGLPPAR